MKDVKLESYFSIPEYYYTTGGSLSGDTFYDSTLKPGVGAVRLINDLYDVSLNSTGMTYDGSVLTYDGSIDRWNYGSINNDIYVKEASLGESFYWTIDGSLEASIGGDVTQSYVDGSLGERDVSIEYLDSSVTWLYNNPAGSSTLEQMTDTSISNIIDESGLLYKIDSSKWENVETLNIRDVMYTKTEVDNLIAGITGGSY